jgi:subtilisin family serine protease
MKSHKIAILIAVFTLVLNKSDGQYLNPVLHKAPFNWFNLDYNEDGVLGVSTERAYRELLNKKKANPVIVAIIDSGVDIEHEDLKQTIWVNTAEIPNNGIDDDQNGYVDDIHGWDFLGSANGVDIQYESFEITREYARLKPQYEHFTVTSTMSASERQGYEMFKNVRTKYEAKWAEYASQGPFVIKLYERYREAKSFLQGYLQVEEVDNRVLANINESSSIDLQNAKKVMDLLPQIGQSEAVLKEGYDYYTNQYNYGLNMTYNPRSIIGDKLNDVQDRFYGNNEVKGPDAQHGTHVAGIIAANRSNELGVLGVANDVKIMVLRAVPDGDERDKDVANAIYYAVNNGAKVINMSFGKVLSPQKYMVDAAVKYAAEHDVLIVHAAGNENENNDKAESFPSKKMLDGTLAPNWIEVGASSWRNAPNAVADFSNYGNKTVDIFAPGVDVNSSVENSKYEELSGTSMAAPVVAGVAAVLFSYYPNLKATDIKRVLLESALKPHAKMFQPGTSKLVDFSSLSVSGGIVNVYQAVKKIENF